MMGSGLKRPKGVMGARHQHMGLCLIVKAGKVLVKQVLCLLAKPCTNQGTDSVPDRPGGKCAFLAGGHENTCHLINCAAPLSLVWREIGDRLPGCPGAGIKRNSLTECSDRSVLLTACMEAKAKPMQGRHMAGIASKDPLEYMASRFSLAPPEERTCMGNVSVMGRWHGQALAVEKR